jgi:hypothetical protein
VTDAGRRGRLRAAAVQPTRAAHPPTTPPIRPNSRLAITPTPGRGITGTVRSGVGRAWGWPAELPMMLGSGTKLRSPDRNSSTAARARLASWAKGFEGRRPSWPSIVVAGGARAMAAALVAVAIATHIASTASSRSGRTMMSPRIRRRLVSCVARHLLERSGTIPRLPQASGGAGPVGQRGPAGGSRASVDTMSVRAKRGGTMWAQIRSIAVSQGPAPPHHRRPRPTPCGRGDGRQRQRQHGLRGANRRCPSGAHTVGSAALSAGDGPCRQGV